jgi:hypothetical protein
MNTGDQNPDFGSAAGFIDPNTQFNAVPGGATESQFPGNGTEGADFPPPPPPPPAHPAGTEGTAPGAEIDLVNTLVTALRQFSRPKADSRIHAAKPDKYDGNRATYESFKRSVELYVAALTTRKDKVLAALSFLTEGDADQWARNYHKVNKIALERGNVTWESFIAALDAQFKDPREAEYARANFVKLKMGDVLAHTFFLKVDELRVKGDLTNPTFHDPFVVEHLQRNMPPNLVLAIANAYEAKKRSNVDTISMLLELKFIDQATADLRIAATDVPISYAEFRRLAIDQDPHVRRFGVGQHSKAESERNPRTSYNTQRSGSTHTLYVPPVSAPRLPVAAPVVASTNGTISLSNPVPAKVKEPDVVPMDIDRSKHGFTGKCYNCKEVGHRSWECPTNPQRLNVRELNTDELRRLLAESEKEHESEEEDF